MSRAVLEPSAVCRVILGFTNALIVKFCSGVYVENEASSKTHIHCCLFYVLFYFLNTRDIKKILYLSAHSGIV